MPSHTEAERRRRKLKLEEERLLKIRLQAEARQRLQRLGGAETSGFTRRALSSGLRGAGIALDSALGPAFRPAALSAIEKLRIGSRIAREGAILGTRAVFSPNPPGPTTPDQQRLARAAAEFQARTGKKPNILDLTDISAKEFPLPIGARPVIEAFVDPFNVVPGLGFAKAGALRAPLQALARTRPVQTAIRPVTRAVERSRIQAKRANLQQAVQAAQAPGAPSTVPSRIREPVSGTIRGEVLPSGAVALPRQPPPRVVPSQPVLPRTPTGTAAARVLERISFKEPGVSLGERVRGGFRGLVSAVFDDLHPIARFVDAAKKGGAQLGMEENPYIWARLLKGVGGKSNTFLEQGTFGKQFWKMESGRAIPDFKGPGLHGILAPIREGRAFEDFSAYLVSRRAIELDTKGIKTGIQMPDAVQAIAQLENANPQFPQIAQQVYKYQDDLLQYGMESGLFSPEMVGRLRQYQNYVPFHRVLEGMETRGFLGQKLANIASPIKRIKGSERLIINPLESAIKNTHVIIDAADRNQVGIMMARLADEIPELQALFRPIKTPTSKVATVTAKELGISIEGLAAADAELLVDIFRPMAYARNANEVTVLINGQRRFFAVDPDLYRGLLAMDKQDLGLFGKFFGAPARWLRAGAILAPDFMVKNPIRDQLSGFIYSRYGFLPGVDWMRGAAQLVGKPKEYHLFRMSGAEMANLVSLDRVITGRTVDEIAKARGFTDYIKNPMELLRIASEFAENASRRGEFARGIRAGVDPLSASFSAREVTQDFSKMGTVTRAINQIIPFFGANVGGWSRMASGFKNDPIRASTKAFLGITLPSLLLYSVNRDDPRYAEVPQWQKDLFWIIPTPGDLPLLRFPKPFMLGQIFGSMPERFFEYLDKRDPELFKESIRNAVEQGAPGFLPQAALPFIENMSNHSFFLDRPIVPRGRENAPPQLQYSGQTSEAAKALGKWVNYPPAKIDNVFRGYTATLGRYVTDIVDPILKKAGITPDIPDPSRTAADIPVLRSFVVRDPTGSTSESVNRFYRKLEEFEGMERTFREHLALGQPRQANQFKDKNPTAGLFYDDTYKEHYSATARALRRIARQMSDVRSQQRVIYNSRSQTPKQKRVALDALNKALTALAQKALRDLEGILPTRSKIEPPVAVPTPRLLLPP